MPQIRFRLLCVGVEAPFYWGVAFWSRRRIAVASIRLKLGRSTADRRLHADFFSTFKDGGCLRGGCTVWTCVKFKGHYWNYNVSKNYNYIYFLFHYIRTYQYTLIRSIVIRVRHLVHHSKHFGYIDKLIYQNSASLRNLWWTFRIQQCWFGMWHLRMMMMSIWLIIEVQLLNKTNSHQLIQYFNCVNFIASQWNLATGFNCFIFYISI